MELIILLVVAALAAGAVFVYFRSARRTTPSIRAPEPEQAVPIRRASEKINVPSVSPSVLPFPSAKPSVLEAPDVPAPEQTFPDPEPHPYGLPDVSPPAPFDPYRPLECKTEWSELPVPYSASRDARLGDVVRAQNRIAEWAERYRTPWSPDGLEAQFRAGDPILFRIIHPVTRVHLRDEELNLGLPPYTL